MPLWIIKTEITGYLQVTTYSNQKKVSDIYFVEFQDKNK